MADSSIQSFLSLAGAMYLKRNFLLFYLYFPPIYFYFFVQVKFLLNLHSGFLHIWLNEAILIMDLPLCFWCKTIKGYIEVLTKKKKMWHILIKAVGGLLVRKACRDLRFMHIWRTLPCLLFYIIIFLLDKSKSINNIVT